jgi:hypothetical protein
LVSHGESIIFLTTTGSNKKREEIYLGHRVNIFPGIYGIGWTKFNIKIHFMNNLVFKKVHLNHPEIPDTLPSEGKSELSANFLDLEEIAAHVVPDQPLPAVLFWQNVEQNLVGANFTHSETQETDFESVARRLTEVAKRRRAQR